MKLSINDITVDRNDKTDTIGKFTISLTEPATEAVTGEYDVHAVPGIKAPTLAEEEVDFVPAKGTFRIEPGKTSTTVDAVFRPSDPSMTLQKIFLCTLSHTSVPCLRPTGAGISHWPWPASV